MYICRSRCWVCPFSLAIYPSAPLGIGCVAEWFDDSGGLPHQVGWLVNSIDEWLMGGGVLVVSHFSSFGVNPACCFTSFASKNCWISLIRLSLCLGDPLILWSWSPLLNTAI